MADIVMFEYNIDILKAFWLLDRQKVTESIGDLCDYFFLV